MKIDQIIRTRRKTIALIVDPQGRLIVRAPLHSSEAQIRKIVEQKTSWIEKKKQLALMRQPPSQAERFREGREFHYLGQRYPLAVVDRRRPLLVLNGRFELARLALPDAERVFENWYRAQARLVLAERVPELANLFGFQFQRLAINGARTRWGSCGIRGSLNFTWRLIMAPEPVIDYVIVHELAHLRVRNHSSQFWELLEKLMPEYRQARAWLKHNGPLLEL
jgi:predicted metal-dependent hydrolase